MYLIKKKFALFPKYFANCPNISLDSNPEVVENNFRERETVKEDMLVSWKLSFKKQVSVI